MNKTIVHIKRQDIDVDKWNACIAGAPNGLIYAYAWWLNEMAVNWDALVLGDYEAVMPLTWKRKFGISYLYQPAFTQQLGIIAAQKLSVEIMLLFIEKAKSLFRFAEIFLNFDNNINDAEGRNNFVVQLNKNPDELQSAYSNILKKNLRRAHNNRLTFTDNYSLQNIVDIYRSTYKSRDMRLNDHDFGRLQAVLKLAVSKDHLLIRVIMNGDNELCAAALCPKDNKRIYFLLAVTPEHMKPLQANHFLVAHLIQEFAQQPLLLDFEGSDMEGIADFYKSFGSINQPYYFLKWNNLPWPVSLLKK